jgi:uncharacterized protein (DUF433 family)
MVKPQIISDPAILQGKPVIAGTRISVELILEKLGADETIEDILIDYPHLTREAILAAVRFGAQALRGDVVYPFPEHVT